MPGRLRSEGPQLGYRWEIFGTPRRPPSEDVQHAPHHEGDEDDSQAVYERDVELQA